MSGINPRGVLPLFAAMSLAVLSGDSLASLPVALDAPLHSLPQGLVTVENGPNLLSYVRLTHPPAPGETVTVTATSDDTSEGLVVSSPMVFDENTWQTYRTVEIDPQTDGINDGDVQYSLTLTVNSTGGLYGALAPSSVSVTNVNVDGFSAALKVTNTAFTATAAGASQFVVGENDGLPGGDLTAVLEVSLSQTPLAEVVVPITAPADGDIQVLASEVRLNAGNSYRAQVTVQGTLDQILDADLVATQIVFGPTTSSDVPFSGLSARTLGLVGDMNDLADGVLTGLAAGNSVDIRITYTPFDPCAVAGLALTCKVTAAGSETLTLNADGAFSFTPIFHLYDTVVVDVVGNPTGPVEQTCSTTQPAIAGVLGALSFNTIQVTCTAVGFTVGGQVTGLAGSGLVLQNNLGDDLPITANGPFTFATPLTDGSPYSVTVLSQPTGLSQTCTVGRQVPGKGAAGPGDGTINGASVNDLLITCTTNSFTVGGQVSGLQGSGLVLRNNAGDDLTVLPGATSFTFATPIIDGGSFDVTVANQPSGPAQTCTVGRVPFRKGGPGNGTINGGPVNDLLITCSTQTFSIGGEVTGLAGSGLVLQNNLGDNLPISANGPFTFPTPLADGSPYSVTVLTQPTNLSQRCTVGRRPDSKGAIAPNSGTLEGAPVTNLLVSCTTNSFTVGGQVSGLVGSGLVLRNNGGDDLPIGANGGFTFATPVIDGGSYNVTIASQPVSPAQTCSVPQAALKGFRLGAGLVAGADISDIPVTCTTDPTPPGPPTQVQVMVGGGRVTVTWAPPANDGGSPITGYAVTLQPGGRTCTVTGAPPPTQCVFDDLPPGNYSAAVVASNGIGTGQPGFGSATASVMIPTGSPAGLALLAALCMLIGGAVLMRRPG